MLELHLPGLERDGRTTSHCVTDLQIQSEINSVITAQGWPRGTGNVYFLFTPQNVGTCYGSSCSYRDFCAYHGYFGSGANTVLYATIPYAASSPVNCGSGQSPNGDDADSTINLVSHEHAEVITDPQLERLVLRGRQRGERRPVRLGLRLVARIDGLRRSTTR